MTDQEQRIAEILRRTREPFKQDARDKIDQLHRLFALCDEGTQTAGAVAESARRHAHSMKGLALTLSFSSVHEACEHILDTILQQEERPWTIPDLENLRALVRRLEEAMNAEFA